MKRWEQICLSMDPPLKFQFGFFLRRLYITRGPTDQFQRMGELMKVVGQRLVLKKAKLKSTQRLQRDQCLSPQENELSSAAER